MRTGPHGLHLRQLTTPAEATPALRQALTDCWIAVTNAGGAAGFPFPPVDARDVAPAVDALASALAPDTSRLLTASLDGDGELAGWLNLRRDPGRLVAHWGTLHHVQTRPDLRGRGIGAALVRYARETAREDLGLEQLHLAARGGAGLEKFYGRLGWRESGRRPGALRFAPGDDRDEVLMFLAPL
ncbi:GNAT family N-acetyltransferase [Streptomyces sp. NPDC058374]|uniref:GNAT family N-acetyltransferase n=1 Tax=unclassified Streptomyces TaxID=2593676 RepID=UPI00364BE347